MAKAYILIECMVGRTREVVTGLKKVNGIISVDTVTGPYDAIAVIEGKTLSEIGDIVTNITAPGIVRTITCLVV
jgi:DNA-binding Lrp family transcriptional regulator